MGDDSLQYKLFREDGTTNDQVIAAIVDDLKDYVFELQGVVLSSTGYSGIPLFGKFPARAPEADVWKIVDTFFRLSDKYPALIFTISCGRPEQHPFYKEAVRNEVLPKGAETPDLLNNSVYGMGSVLHVVTPATRTAHPKVADVDIVRQFPRETRNILLTEAVKQKVKEQAATNFGMHRISANLPEQIAYVARQRPDLLSQAVREFAASKGHHDDAELILEASTRVMVHVNLNDRDHKTVTEFCDIDGPADIVSHRIAVALIDFDRKYSNCQNGDATPHDEMYSEVKDGFEKERLSSLAGIVKGERPTIAHLYQCAKALITESHIQICYNLYQEGAYSSDGGQSVCSVEEAQRPNGQRKQVRKKRSNGIGKKRTLAAVINNINKPPTPAESDDELHVVHQAASGLLRNFERAVNGYDAYKASSDEKSLGEEDDVTFFAARSKNRAHGKKKHHYKRAEPGLPQVAPPPQSGSEEEGFDVADFLDAIPPLATNDEFDDI